MELIPRVCAVLEKAYDALQRQDQRWHRAWTDIALLINPNGPLVERGSDGDNGQTGRKLVIDYYGPRVPIGGGALSGKDLAHIDRAGAYAARKAAIGAVDSGARTCQVTLVYAPNLSEPLDVCYEMEGRGDRWEKAAFGHEQIRTLSAGCRALKSLGAGGHFYEETLPWNQRGATCRLG